MSKLAVNVVFHILCLCFCLLHGVACVDFMSLLISNFKSPIAMCCICAANHDYCQSASCAKSLCVFLLKNS